MADGVRKGLGRVEEVGGEAIETIEQDRGDAKGPQLLQTVAEPCIAGAVVVNGQHDVDGASVEVVAANEKRLMLSMFNYGDVTVFIRADGIDATTDDFPLPPGAGFTDRRSTRAWKMIGETSGADIRTLEISLP